MIVAPVAENIARTLHAALKGRRIARIDIDVIRACCEVVASIDGWTGDEINVVTNAVVRRVVELTR